MRARLPRLRPRVPRRLRVEGDTGSMAMFLTIAVVGLAIAALLVPMVISSSRTTRSDTSRVHALDAAQAGINVMVGEIRASVIDGVGTSTLLPCGTTAGVVNSTGAASYTTSISYYMSDPVSTSGAQKMTCVDGYGTYDPVSDTFTPKFARITSVGKDGAAVNGSTPGRTLATTYVFRTTTTNIVGGRIRINPASGSTTEMCMDAGTATPNAAALVTLQSCATPPKDQQIFAYRSDLTLQLLSSVTATYANGLCLDTKGPPTADATVFLGTCSVLGSPPYTQQWSYNDNGGYTASVATSATTGTLSSLCISSASQGAGSPLKLASCGAGSTSSTTQSWIPSPAVGAGAAQAPQLVNFFEFGRCVDVTNQDTGIDHLIAYPCKQNPQPASITFNQKFTIPGIAAGATSAVGPIYTTRGGVNYCLTSPDTNAGYVRTLVCDGTNARQRWTVYNGSSALSYSAKYTVVDASSRCLGLTDPKGNETWSAIDVETCTGATEQKWNATADLSSSVFQDVAEVP